MQRLKTRAQFEAVMAGITVSRTPHFALHRIPLDAETPSPRAAQSATSGRLPIPPMGPGSLEPKALFGVRDVWVGALVPKRWAKRAVTRNAIKRQIYTVSQAALPPLPAAAHVVRLRAGFDRAQFISASSQVLKRAVRGELQELFARAEP
ncbi:MAG TPA: ribonuclease P protein component [Ramlibacter sp.]|nr:ribonuclease P protein component [Ramlibacter sp.]